MQTFIKRDEIDSDMFHVYGVEKKTWQSKVPTMKTLLFPIHEDSLRVFGDTFRRAALRLEPGEESDIDLRADIF